MPDRPIIHMGPERREKPTSEEHRIAGGLEYIMAHPGFVTCSFYKDDNNVRLYLSMDGPPTAGFQMPTLLETIDLALDYLRHVYPDPAPYLPYVRAVQSPNSGG